MERSMKQYDKEYMKTAILKHEQTFREQVSELHRLYRVQRMLMRDVKRNALERPETCDIGHQKDYGGIGRWHAAGDSRSSFRGGRDGAREIRPRRALDLERPAEEYVEDDCDVDTAASEMEEEEEIELTLATGSRRRKKEETSLTSESGAASFSSSSAESGGENPKLQDWGLIQFAAVSNGIFHGDKKGEKRGEFGVETMRQDALKQPPPWLFQCLSLNMT